MARKSSSSDPNSEGQMKQGGGGGRAETHAAYIAIAALDRPVYIDIDGTLTREPYRMWGEVITDRVRIVREILDAGYQVVLWSGGGTQYARAFAQKYGLSRAVAIGKPELCVDDNPTIRPKFSERVYSPEEWFIVGSDTLPDPIKSSTR